MQSILVTGGAGFIGCNFVRLLLATGAERVIVLDKLTYAGNLLNLADVSADPRYTFVQGDIADAALLRQLFAQHHPQWIVNFAAESHVDRSIDGPRAFVETNTVGTFELLEATRQHLKDNPAEVASCRFLHVSTDEVYGSLGASGEFSETTPYAPSSPYSASKAAADHLARAYFATYGLPVLITNCSNNFGPYQFPEKLIPLTVLNALEAKDLPIYGDGGNIRDWLYVEDHCLGILAVLQRGRLGEKYNIGAGNELRNVDLVDQLCGILDDLVPDSTSLRARGMRRHGELKRFVSDRPGHDRRYAVDARKIRTELGWAPQFEFAAALRRTIAWYLTHRDWCSAVQENSYGRERLGTAAPVGQPPRSVP